MYKFNDKSLARYRYKQKQNLSAYTLENGFILSTQSPNLVSNSPYLPQVGLCEARGSDILVKL